MEVLKNLVNILLSKRPFFFVKETSTGTTIQWLPVSELSEYNIGVCSKGYWVVETRDGLVLLNGSNSFVYLLSMLEKSRLEITRRLILFSNSIGSDIDIITVFPFQEITKAGFNQGSNYWAELAFAWYDSFCDIEKKEFVDILSNVMNSKWASQKIRQKAKKELRFIDW